MKKLTTKCWALYNINILWGTARTRKECVEEAEKQSLEPWRMCKEYFHVRKVIVSTV